MRDCAPFACRWKSVVVATNPFHQFRAYRTFQCASKQTLPPDERPQVIDARATNALLSWALMSCVTKLQRLMYHSSLPPCGSNVDR